MDPFRSKMKRMPSKKSHSWWWDSHIGRKNSKWLAENLAEMDKSVKEMLTLIEEEGDSFAKKAEMYYQRRPELISHVEDFYRMYRALAERYDQVTRDLRKNIRSEPKSQGSGSVSDLVSGPPPSDLQSPEVTPESKSQHSKLSSRAAGFDFFLHSSSSADISSKNSDSLSSSSSDSESDVDDSNEISGDSSSSYQRILELEDELRELKEKLKVQEEQCYHDHKRLMENGQNLDFSFKIMELEGQLSDANGKLHDSEAEIIGLKEKLEEKTCYVEIENTELSFEKKVSKLEEQVFVLQEAILGYKHEIEHLNGAAEIAVKQFEFELSNRDCQIEEYKNELTNSKEKFLQDKSSLEHKYLDLEAVNMVLKEEADNYLVDKLSLEARISELEHVIHDLEISSSSSTEKLLLEKTTLEADILALSQSKAFVEANVITLDGQIRQLEADKTAALEESQKHIAELNQNLDALRLKVDMLTAEKEELTDKVNALLDDVKYRDDKLCQMDQHLHQLHLEHAKLITEIEETRRFSSELRVRVKELEEEVDKQKAAISDGAEGKREAIRQLCFSLEHYRDGYHQLRQLLQGHKRSVIMAT